MRRRLLNLLTALSLLLCLAACGLWVRGYWVKDLVGWPRANGHATLASNRGQFVLIVMRHQEPERYYRPAGFYYRRVQVSHYSPLTDYQNPLLTVHFQRLRFSSHTWRSQTPESQTWLKVPHYAVAAVTAALPLAAAYRHAARRRRGGRGLCPSCGYDLRATPDRCPECGTARPAE